VGCTLCSSWPALCDLLVNGGLLHLCKRCEEDPNLLTRLDEMGHADWGPETEFQSRDIRLISFVCLFNLYVSVVLGQQQHNHAERNGRTDAMGSPGYWLGVLPAGSPSPVTAGGADPDHEEFLTNATNLQTTWRQRRQRSL
jgi:hypothetical protein